MIDVIADCTREQLLLVLGAQRAMSHVSFRAGTSVDLHALRVLLLGVVCDTMRSGCCVLYDVAPGETKTRATLRYPSSGADSPHASTSLRHALAIAGVARSGRPKQHQRIEWTRPEDGLGAAAPRYVVLLPSLTSVRTRVLEISRDDAPYAHDEVSVGAALFGLMEEHIEGVRSLGSAFRYEVVAPPSDRSRQPPISSRSLDEALLAAPDSRRDLASRDGVEPRSRGPGAEVDAASREFMMRERLASLGRLAATLAHEVRNPLGVLFNSIATLSKKLPLGGDASDLLVIMGEEVRRLDRLVHELLDFARPISPLLEAESVALLVESALDALRGEFGVGLRVSAEVSSALPLVRMDGTMMRRVLVNLVRNSLQAAGLTGSVRVRAEVDVRDGLGFARIDVVDDGPGISRGVIAHVFEPFYTTRATGTGLGLAIVKSIVDAHHGEVALVSSDVGGTIASVWLPLVE